MKQIKILTITPYDEQGPSSRYRVHEVTKRMDGLKFYKYNFMEGDFYREWMRTRKLSLKIVLHMAVSTWKLSTCLIQIKKFDVVFVHRRVSPLFSGFFNQWLLRSRIPIIFDMDDAVFTEYNIDDLLRGSKAVSVGNRYLSNYVHKLAPDVETLIVPTVVDINRYLPRKEKNQGRVVVGWIGTGASFKSYLLPYLEEVTQTCQALGAVFQVIASKEVRNEVEEGGAEFVEWSLNQSLTQLQNFDIGIMPLKDDTYVRGKCAFKLIEYGAIGIASVGSNIGSNSEVLEQGVTGFLAESKSEFLNYLRTLIENQSLRESMGKAARKRIVEFYSLEKQVLVLKNLFEKVASTKE